MKGLGTGYIFGIIAVALVLGLSIAGGYFKFPFFIGNYGLEITSVDAPDYVQGGNLKDYWWLIDASVTNGGERIVGTLNPSDAKTLSGKSTQYPLTIDVTALDESLRYDVVNLEEPIYKINYVFTNFGEDCDAAATRAGVTKPECQGQSSYGTDCGWTWYWLPIGGSGFCAYMEQVGIYGGFGNPSIKDEATVELTANGITKSVKVSNQNKIGTFYDSSNNMIARVSFLGSLVTGDPAPNQDNFRPYYNFNTNIWKTARETDVDNIDDEAQSKKSVWDANYKAPLYVNREVLKAEAISYNARVDSLLLQNVKISDASYEQWQNQGSETAGYLLVNLNRQILTPELTIKVRADWIGIETTAGEPQIVSLSCPTFDLSSGEGVINTKVKNIGTATGKFIYTVSGCSPFGAAFSSATNTKSVLSGSILDFGIVLQDGGWTTDITKTCTVKVTDSQSGLSDSGTVSCTAKAVGFCTDGRERIVGNCIQDCISKEWVTRECCPNGVITNPQTGKYECSGEAIPPTPESWIWLIIPLIAVLGALIGYKLSEGIGLGIGVIVGGLAGYGIFWFFSLAIWQQALLTLGLVGGGALLIYVLIFGGGLALIAALIIAIKK